MDQFLKTSLAVLTLACVCTACEDKKYDLSNGFNKDLTLFEEQISVPVGSIGPFTVESLLKGNSIIQALSQLLVIEEDGSMFLKSDKSFYAVNVYEMEKEVGDVSLAFTYKPGDKSGDTGVSFLMDFLKLQALEQELSLTARNPLRPNVHLRSTLELKTSSSAVIQEIPLDVTLKGNRPSAPKIFEAELPADLKESVAYISMKDPELDMPAQPSQNLYDGTSFDVFSFSCAYRCRIGVKKDFSFPQSVDINDAGLALGKYKLSRCDISLELQNSLPLSVVLNSVQLINTGADGEEVVDENIDISSDITIAGATAAGPGVTSLKLHVAAKEGTIPDIHHVKIDLAVKGSEGSEGIALSARQGVYVKSSSATVTGGITIPLK